MPQVTNALSQRGRPSLSQEQKQRQRAHILNAARQLFAHDGYQGVSIRKVANSAGCSPAVIYKYFTNKRELLLHLWEDIFQQLAESIEACYNTHKPPKQLEEMLLVLARFWLARPDDYRAIFLIEDQPEGEGELYFLNQSSALSWMELFHSAIVSAQQAKHISPGPVEEKIAILFCGIQGVLINVITIPEYPWGDTDILVKAMIETLLNGI